MAWLVRWSVRDWASCFSVCRLPLDDHELTSSPHVAFDKKNEQGFNSICNNNLSRPCKKCNNKRQLNTPIIIKDKDDGVPIANRFNHSSWSLSADENYIVFCFGEDGALDVVNDNKGVKFEGLDRMHKNSRPLNRKLEYSEDEQDSDLNIHEKRSHANQHHSDHQQDQDCVAPYKEVHCHHPDLSLQEEKEEMAHTSSTQQHRDSIRRACHVLGIENHRMVSAESRESEEGSRGSFAFPVLVWEWIGSPVQMPKSEGLHLKKHKARFVPLQCFRF
ncbi:protein BREAKING OF ASYMMETRY IN THE STOMATAL LINEAGE [Abrus precatorius]|uniref:Protein BREAKING OF ASYMMETRY IN THE STOMATAL LINEAGE n=1 Tax=Abrus precatorius TaxID=3816 RepID=A0A8B8MLN4_ABRPR|nr:protein BREAKING OF ASYMMETRY IN THE STOMATAL LINEAGE [Abrus precatorius]